MGPYGFVWVVQWLDEFFYVDDRLIALPRMARLQEALEVLMGISDRFGLHTYVDKTVGMVC